MAVFGTPVGGLVGVWIEGEGEGEGGGGKLTGVELVCYFLFTLLFVEEEEFVSVRDVNSV